MPSWKRLWSFDFPSAIQSVRLALPDWHEEAPEKRMRVWRNSCGDVISLALAPFPDASGDSALRKWCRRLAEDQGAGLIEANEYSSRLGTVVSFIYKRLQMPAYVYTGFFFFAGAGRTFLVTIVAGEHGITGIREAAVTSQLLASGALKIEDYERAWGQDPYDPTYRGVDKSVLRSMSDDPVYDEKFRNHPLSKIRHIIGLLPSSLDFAPRNLS